MSLNQKIIKIHRLAYITIVLFVLGGNFAYAAEYTHGDACSQAGMLHGKDDTNGFYYLLCNGSTWNNTISYTSAGRIGIGTTSPISRFNIVSPRNYGAGGLNYTESTLDITGNSDEYPGLSVRSYGGTTTWEAPTISLLRHRGTVASPSAPQSGDVVGYIGAKAYNATNGPKNANVGQIVFMQTAAPTANGNPGAMYFQTNDGTNSQAITRLTINSSGNVGIGTETPGAALHVVGNINYTGVITDISDARKKTDIRQLGGALERVSSLKGVAFRMKDDPKREVELGLIAQDVQRVYPELVKTLPDGGLSLNYQGMIGPLVEAVKELNDENNALEVENAALRDAVRDLTLRVEAIERAGHPLPVRSYND